MLSDCDAVFSQAAVAAGGLSMAALLVTLHAIGRYRGLVIFVAEKVDSLTPAFLRFVGKCVEFRAPDEAVRRALWERLIPEKAPAARDIDYSLLARTFPDFTGGNIAAAIIRASEKKALCRAEEKDMLDTECLLAAGREEDKASRKGWASESGLASMYQ